MQKRHLGVYWNLLEVWLCLVFLSLFFLVDIVWCLDNGLARTPPMGWLAWTRFMCQVDCQKFPNDCISEKLFTEMADVLVSEGYRDAGYDRVNVDDCWATRHRDDTTGRLVPDPERFSHGIPWLANYMHSRGLKLGMYASFGRRTCMGYPGTFTDEQMTIDAGAFAEWNVDMVKYDGCFTDPMLMDKAYPAFGAALNKTGRSMVYGCSWPYYQLHFGPKFGHSPMTPDYNKIVSHCHLWRNHHDIQMRWESVLDIINYYDYAQEKLAAFHGPGHWNDPDMIIIGNPGLSLDQCRVQMALWSIWSAPLLISNDLRAVEPEGAKEILLNRRVIAVDQDPLGIMGTRIDLKGTIRVYSKPMMPADEDSGYDVGFSHALAFFNHGQELVGSLFKLEDLGLKRPQGYTLHDLFTDESLGVKLPNDVFDIKVPPTGVVMLKATIVSPVKVNTERNILAPRGKPFQKTDNANSPVNFDTMYVISVTVVNQFALFGFCTVILLLSVTIRKLRRYRAIVVAIYLLCFAYFAMRYLMELW